MLDSKYRNEFTEVRMISWWPYQWGRWSGKLCIWTWIKYNLIKRTSRERRPLESANTSWLYRKHSYTPHQYSSVLPIPNQCSNQTEAIHPDNIIRRFEVKISSNYTRYSFVKRNQIYHPFNSNICTHFIFIPNDSFAFSCWPGTFLYSDSLPFNPSI